MMANFHTGPDVGSFVKPPAGSRKPIPTNGKFAAVATLPTPRPTLLFLIFAISRPDVWPVGDYRIKVAMKNQFRLRKLPDVAKLTKIAEPWKPYRSVASWYLWRRLE